MHTHFLFFFYLFYFIFIFVFLYFLGLGWTQLTWLGHWSRPVTRLGGRRALRTPAMNYNSLATIAKQIIRQRKAGNEKAFTWCGETKSKTMVMACLDNASVVLSFCLSPPSFYAHCFLGFSLPLFSLVSSSVVEVMKVFYRPSPLFHSTSSFLSSWVLYLPLALCF